MEFCYFAYNNTLDRLTSPTVDLFERFFHETSTEDVFGQSLGLPKQLLKNKKILTVDTIFALSVP